MEAKFYHFNQNNSGGYFIQNDEYGICEDVIIQAVGAKQAFEKLEAMESNVPNLFSYCSCCGERWSNWLADSDGTDVPTIYGEPLELLKQETFQKRCYVHYHDGTFKLFEHKENEPTN